jgi:hypothetical protein
MHLPSFRTKSAVLKGARWSTVPAVATAAIALAAGPALAAGTSVGIATSGSASAGLLELSGAYQCPTSSPYDSLSVTVSQDGRYGTVRGTTVQQVACVGSTLTWRSVVSPSGGDGWFAAGPARVSVTLWAPGAWDDRAESSIVLFATAS